MITPFVQIKAQWFFVRAFINTKTFVNSLTCCARQKQDNDASTPGSNPPLWQLQCQLGEIHLKLDELWSGAFTQQPLKSSVVK
jgi:hypothetical protein